MNFLGLIYLLMAHYVSGRGVLRLFRISLQPLTTVCLSFIIGVALLSFVPCFVQLLHIPITFVSIVIGVGLFTFALSIPSLITVKQPVFKKITFPAGYEWPFIAVISLVMAVSVWRCFYNPPLARDMLTGPELLAEYAVREHTMLSSVFSIDLSTSNNYFKSPYITGLQIIYKLLVCPFGQLWLSVLSLSFIIWMYSLVRSLIHPLIAGFLMLFFMVQPDFYAYTYLILYDYSNTVFFFCGFYFLHRWYVEERQLRDFAFAAFLFGIATYIRTETLVLVAMTAPLVLFFLYRMHIPFKKMVLYKSILILTSAFFYLLCIDVFVHNFIPIPFDLHSQLNPHLLDISPFFRRLRDIITVLIFSKQGMKEYGYFIFFFCGLLLADTICTRRFNSWAKIALYGILTVYIGLAFLGYLLPLVDLPNTTKRGFFKALPLMLLYMANSGLLQRLSGKIRKWEAG